MNIFVCVNLQIYKYIGIFICEKGSRMLLSGSDNVETNCPDNPETVLIIWTIHEFDHFFTFVVLLSIFTNIFLST